MPAMSAMRPPMLAGPMERQRNPASVAESSCALCAACAAAAGAMSSADAARRRRERIRLGKREGGRGKTESYGASGFALGIKSARGGAVDERREILAQSRHARRVDVDHVARAEMIGGYVGTSFGAHGELVERVFNRVVRCRRVV